MKKLVPFFILILLLSGCSVNKKIPVDNGTSTSQVNINNTLNQILINSGLLGKNIYDADSRVTELEVARNKSFMIPDGYELALDVK